MGYESLHIMELLSVQCLQVDDVIPIRRQSFMFISTTGIMLYYAKYLPFIIYYGSTLLLFTRKLHCLKTFEHMSALLAIKPKGVCEVSYTSTRVFEISRETCKRYMLLFTNM